jgi:methylenetetrahydrofolate dehydrogenase (NADP+)/methenyltetrahydrofolate cyclohydrolase
MSATIISGKAIGEEIRAELRERIAHLSDRGLRPGLATVLVGENPASQMYVGMKNQAAKDLGLHSRQITLSAEASQA